MNDKKWVVTFDTCCIIAGKGDPDVKQLLEWHDEGVIDIVKTDVVDTELVAPRHLERASNYHEDIGAGVYGHSRYGHSVYAGDEDVKRGEAIQAILFPGESREKLDRKQIRDIMALATHQKHGRDFFVTKDNRHLLEKQTELKSKLGIEVLSPRECVGRIG